MKNKIVLNVNEKKIKQVIDHANKTLADFNEQHRKQMEQIKENKVIQKRKQRERRR